MFKGGPAKFRDGPAMFIGGTANFKGGPAMCRSGPAMFGGGPASKPARKIREVVHRALSSSNIMNLVATMKFEYD